MPSLKTRNLFISHSWTYTDTFDGLVKLLNAAPLFFYKNYSVPKDDPIHNAPNVAALHQAIKGKIAYCHVVVIMAGKYASYSKWIQREIQIAKTEYGKPVLAVRPWANAQISSVVRENADRLVGWNTNSIVSAIREVSP